MTEAPIESYILGGAPMKITPVEEIKNPQPAVYESAELGKLFEALSKAQGEIEIAKEDSLNPFFKSKYSDLASVINASRPYLSKFGLSVIQRIMANGNGTSYLFTRLCHASGQWMESRMNLLPTKPDMQGMGSAISYARRYAYSAMIGVVTGLDDDGNAACSSPKSEETSSTSNITQMQAKKILERLAEINDESLLDKILEFFNISALSYLPQNQFDQCMNKMKNFGGKK